MAKLIPALILFFVFISSCNAGPPVASSENEVTSLPVTSVSEEDVSDLKPLILLPTDTQFHSDPVPLVNGEKNDIPAIESIDNGVKKLEWEPMNPRFGRMRSIRCRRRRFGGDGQIRPRERPLSEEEDDEFHHHHHHHHHHGEMFGGARFHEVSGGPGVEGDVRMIGEFKQPDFFFRRHHHHHHHHHHDDDDEEFHHHDEEEEMEHHHRHRRGFWRRIRKVLAHF